MIEWVLSYAKNGEKNKDSFVESRQKNDLSPGGALVEKLSISLLKLLSIEMESGFTWQIFNKWRGVEIFSEFSCPHSLRKFYGQCELEQWKGLLHQIGIGYKWLNIN